MTQRLIFSLSVSAFIQMLDINLAFQLNCLLIITIKVLRPVYYLKEGSAMFGLENKDDAMRWRGIFNHIMGTARQVYFLARILKNISPETKRQFSALGLDAASFDEIDPELLRDFMFISHSRRRETDEKNWHKLDDEVHQETDPGTATLKYLKNLKTPAIFIDLMRVESHVDHLAKVSKQTILPSIVDNILTYCDWTFGQTANTLEERFSELRRSQRAEPHVLNILEKCGNTFDTVLKQTASPTIWQEMTTAGPFEWETEIRRAYCISSSLQFQNTFPLYLQQFPQVNQQISAK